MFAGNFSKNPDAMMIPRLKTNGKAPFILHLLSNKPLDFAICNPCLILRIQVCQHCVPAMMGVALEM
jgi:hypothetical protein